jgi:hypothetical protein
MLKCLFIGIVQCLGHLFHVRFGRFNQTQEILPGFCGTIILGAHKVLIKTVQITIKLTALLVNRKRSILSSFFVTGLSMSIA